MARNTAAPPRRRGDSGTDSKRGRYEEDREVSGDRVSYQGGNENPEITERADALREPETNAPVRENGDAGEPAEAGSHGGSPQRREENGDMAAEHKQSPRYSSERRSERMSRSPGPRRNSGFNDAEPEDRRGRRRGSGSASPAGSSPRR